MNDLAPLLLSAAAVATLLLGLREYSRQGRQRRAEHFIDIGSRLLTSESTRAVLQALAPDSEPGAVSAVPIRDRADFLALCETVALLVQSRLIRRKAAFYMLGPSAVAAFDCDEFWSHEGYLDRNAPNWALYREFVIDARRYLRAGPEPRDLRL